MDMFLVLKIVSILGCSVLLLYSWQKIASAQIRLVFICTIVVFLLSMVLTFPDESHINQWIRHVPFYVGQVLLFFFLRMLIKAEIDLEHATKHGVSQNVELHSVGIISWFIFLTEQGLQHLIPVPLLFLTYSVISMQFGFFSSKLLRKTLKYFLSGSFFLCLIHFGEFLIESQSIFTLLSGDVVETMEFLWFFLGMFFFGLGVRTMTSQYKEGSAKQSGLYDPA